MGRKQSQDVKLNWGCDRSVATEARPVRYRLTDRPWTAPRASGLRDSLAHQLVEAFGHFVFEFFAQKIITRLQRQPERL